MESPGGQGSGAKFQVSEFRSLLHPRIPISHSMG